MDKREQSLSFYRERPDGKIYWVDTPDQIGVHLFSFDKKRIYNLFADYPHALSEEEVRTFDEEEPEWANYFRGRRSE